MTSPHKTFGSFLNKTPLSPIQHKSSPKATSSPSPKRPRSVSPAPADVTTRTSKARPSWARRSLPQIDDMNSKDFVVIAPPPRKRRVLTEHQKEVMREQRTNIPALYSAADATQVGHVTIHV